MPASSFFIKIQKIAAGKTFLIMSTINKENIENYFRPSEERQQLSKSAAIRLSQGLHEKHLSAPGLSFLPVTQSNHT